MKRENHYEAALEAWLRERQVPYVAVDEVKRSRLGATSLKNLDFILSPVGSRPGLLIDVKGRRFPSGRQPQYWKNWSTRDDVASLARWQQLFGVQFVPLLVFAYEVAGELAPLPYDELFAFRRRLYGFVAVRLDHYASSARIISPRWGTLAMPVAQFRQLARPLAEFLAARPRSEQEDARSFANLPAPA
jgi:hypothetical protein